MIRNFIHRLVSAKRSLGSPAAAASQRTRFGKRVEHGPEEHGIAPELVDERAANVVRTLKGAGYEAYIVGGAVRDLLLGLKPKDFDVATSATPEQVKGLFRRAYIVGRRFRIVHVVHGRGRQHERIEVSTFRAYFENGGEDIVEGNEHTAKHQLVGMKHAVGASGRVLRDNVWGTQEEDAARRDFTLNAMYYDPETRVVVDYHGGMADMRRKVLRMIGDPMQRYREDPVRVLRAARFAAKLAARGFHLDPKTAAPLAEAKKLLADIPQSRMFDEMLKFLQTGHALASVEKLKELGLDHGLYPLLDLTVERAGDPMIAAALRDTDRRVAEGKPVAPSFLLACLLWRDVAEGWERQRQGGLYPFPALHAAIDEVFDTRIGDVSGSGKLGADMRVIWVMQPRFEKRSSKSAYNLVQQLRFRAGLDFLRLRVDIGEEDDKLLTWWQAFSTADEAQREDLVAQARAEQRERQPSRKRSGGAKHAGADEEGQDEARDGASSRDGDPGADADTAGADAPKPHRRRRRRSGGSRSRSSSGTKARPRGSDAADAA